MTVEKEVVTLEEAKEQVSKVCHRLGSLHLSFAEIMVKELGEEKGKELVLKAIKNYAGKIGKQVKAKITAQGLDNTVANYQEDLPLYGMHGSTESVEVEGEQRKRVYSCAMAKVWNELDKSKLGRLYCYVDPAKYMTFNANFKLVHLKTLPDGDEYCEMAIRPTTEQERVDFANEEKDWSYLDG